MRTITKEIATAFLAGEAKSLGNTATNGREVFLFNNIIARKMEDGTSRVSLAGWNTPTTRERVNGILRLSGSSKGVSTKKGQARLSDSATGLTVDISSNDWITV